ncbi:BTAD domain-containing putative transcriptional regulator [Pseudosporangium ferrugineum]|uniref:DNA-binding SARP family transcriptional activator n=1 Tax=Pseudosporangium ferrugineum TaxID=439699 RepID=A0A2T0RIT8_9ACTN|nr:BTAD domain-containing putative transcriptional regulator [Pseudosporangium ferrugineum]PRY21069.1 DNA-binding SARP family transcriptional activator [Pseudosporangium ferrugineum]
MADAAPGPGLTFELLGEVRAIRDGAPLELGPAKQRAVLAVLLLNAARPVPVHHIVDAVWNDEPPENGANVVQKYVAGLRRVLEPDRSPRTPGELLALTGAGYVLRAEPDAVDADRFETALAQASVQRKSGNLADAADTLRKALALWHGPALAGLTGPVFDAARTRLTEARATAWEKWAEAELARGNHTGVMPDLVRLVEEFPLREGLRAQLMIALHQGGRQAEALAAFRDARAYFLEEFGVEPGERMQETHRRILRGEAFYAEAVDPWADSDDLAAVTPPPAPASPAPPPTYVQHYVPPDQTFPAPGWGAGPPPQLPPPQPPPSLPPPPRKRFPAGEVIFASLLPIIVCSFGCWIYFTYAGFHRREPRQFAVAGGYAFLFLVAFIVAAIDPTPVESNDLSTAESIGFGMLFLLAAVSAIHGGILAAHPGDTPRARTLREQSRQFAAFDPVRARLLGVGRPDLVRLFDDGGLVDLNHAPGHELARLPGISPEAAHRIVIGRFERPYSHPEELIMRGLVSPRTMHRIGSRLICIAPARSPEQAPWTNPYQPH